MNKALTPEIKRYTENFNYEQYFYNKMNQMVKRSIFIYGINICFGDFYYMYLVYDKDLKKLHIDIAKLTNKEKIQLIRECIKNIYYKNKYEIDKLIQPNIIKKTFNVSLLHIIPKLKFTSLERVKKTIDSYQIVNNSTHIAR